MSIKLLATIGSNLELSSDINKLWNLPKNEKRINYIINNTNSFILVDTSTFQSEYFKPNNNVLLYGNKSLENICDIICYDNINDICKRFEYSDDTLWIIGSTGKFYKEFMDKASFMDITVVCDYRKNPHSYFPLIDDDDWDMEYIFRNDKNIIYSNNIYKRKVRK